MRAEHAAASAIRRQWGTDRDPTPQPALHPMPSGVRIVRARLAPILCVTIWVLYLVTVVVALARGGALADAGQLLATVIFLISVTLLTFSACMWLLARASALPRFASHRRVRRRALDEQYAAHAPTLTALLPSRTEDPSFVRMSLWSVALQEFPRLRVVLLLDDDPVPQDPALRDSLECNRALPAELMAQLRPMQERTQAAAALLRDDRPSAADATAIVMREHQAAAQWLREQADAVPTRTHVEQFFADQVLRRLASDLETTAAALHEATIAGDHPLTPERAQQVLARVVNIFSAEASVFERKRYSTLSHTPNKAMNLNSYLGLLGGRYAERREGGRLALVPESAAPVGARIVDVPDSDYILTLDADSMLLPEYCLRLVHVLEQPQNRRIAVVQTPYSAYRGAPTRIERLAGATTDLQHIVHQGLTAWNATFWVGANAILRRASLEDIRRESVEDGVRVVRYISDRTVIEDTESSIDIAAHGWSLMNYPERLSYSATPPDFGALVIQRHRWADGGLLILPKLMELAARRRREGHPLRLAETLLRVNYLGSIAWATLGLIAVLTLYPLNGQLVTVLLVFIVLPYFIEMASDLRHLGYRRRDAIGIYGLNLLLLAVNLAGTLTSIGQALTGRKARFARTPKVTLRTPAPPLAVLAPLAIVVGATFVSVRAAIEGAWGTTFFAGISALAAAWAILALVGLRNALSDVWFGWLDWLWVAAPAATEPARLASPRWVTILDDGPLEALGAVR